MDKRNRPKPTQTFFAAAGVDVVGVAAWVCVLAGVVVVLVVVAAVADDEGNVVAVEGISLVSSKRADKTCMEASVN